MSALDMTNRRLGHVATRTTLKPFARLEWEIQLIAATEALQIHLFVCEHTMANIVIDLINVTLIHGLIHAKRADRDLTQVYV